MGRNAQLVLLGLGDVMQDLVVLWRMVELDVWRLLVVLGIVVEVWMTVAVQVRQMVVIVVVADGAVGFLVLVAALISVLLFELSQHFRVLPLGAFVFVVVAGRR